MSYPLTGRFVDPAKRANTHAVLDVIKDAQRDEQRRRQTTGQSLRGLPGGPLPPRRPEVHHAPRRPEAPHRPDAHHAPQAPRHHAPRPTILQSPPSAQHPRDPSSPRRRRRPRR